MLISDLNYVEVISEETAIEGGNLAVAIGLPSASVPTAPNLAIAFTSTTTTANDLGVGGVNAFSASASASVAA